VKLEVRGSHRNKKVIDAAFQQLLDEFDERMDGFVEKLPEELAQALLKEVTRLAPKGQIEGYPDFLTVSRVQGKTDGYSVYCVIPSAKGFKTRLKSGDSLRVVLDVHPKVIGGKVDEASMVLARRNPWTMGTLPYEPPKRDAQIVSRKVTEKEARFIEYERRKQREDVVKELKALGKPIRAESKVLLEQKVERDLYWEVTRIEFGLSAVAKPHWRPATRALTKELMRRTLDELLRRLFDPDDSGMTRPRTVPIEPSSVVERVRRFQDKVMP
jgi:hypothetical protein